MTEEKKHQGKHRNDIYSNDLTTTEAEAKPLLNAATVILLRDTDAGQVEVLMLQKNKSITFGGMWVFPGGKIDEADYPVDKDIEIAAKNAAIRETEEESGLKVSGDDFVLFAHWTPPASAPKRFATWFFAAAAQSDDAVTIDGGEILNHRWINPQEALDHHAAGEIDLAPPTWITLYQLSLFNTSAALLQRFQDSPIKVYKTNVGKNAAGERIVMWHGDAGYENSNAEEAGKRHRLIMAPGGFRFEHTAEEYS
ncbi:MAG: NUDIX hydrolase [Pseudomonadales bacterium]|nr:NUDIX hydrolase [Pseudomonadales bacterium]